MTSFSIASTPAWHSIGGRLLGAFGLVAAATVVSVFVAVIAVERLSDDLSNLTNTELNSAVTAARIAEFSGNIRSEMPKLLTANSENERIEARQEIRTTISELEAILQAEAFSSRIENAESLLALLPSIAQNLNAIDENVGSRFEIRRMRGVLIERLRWAHADFLDEIDPIVEDSRFNMESSLDRLESPFATADLSQERATLERMAEMREAVMRINASGNLAVGLIMRGAVQENVDDIDATRQLLAEASDALERAMTLVEDEGSTVSLRQSVRDILAHAVGDMDLLALRRQELLYESKGAVMLVENRDLLDRLERQVSSHITTAYEMATRSIAQTDARIHQDRIVLILAAALSVGVFIFVGWGYVAKRILSRLAALRASMRAIASGDLEADINVSGRDEIAEMAEALVVFRNTARDVENSFSKSIIDNSLVGLIATDEDGVVEFINPSACRFFGVEQAEVEGQAFTVAFLSLRPDLTWRAIISGVDGAVHEVERTGPDGSKVFWDFAARPYRLRRAQKYLVSILDVTERRQMNALLEKRVQDSTAQLHEANAQLRTEIQEKNLAQEELVQAAKLAVLGQMSATIAHETNQTLAAITYNAHNGRVFLTRNKTDEASQCLDKIGGIAEQMGATINRLKIFARRPSQSIGPVRLDEVVRHAALLFEDRVAMENIQLDMSGVAPPVTALGESIRLEQVVVNLISNALDSMKKAGGGILTLRCYERDGRGVIEVADNGSGLTSEIEAHIFEPFFTTKEPGEGLGIGLSITKKIVSDLGGVMEVDRAEPQGAVFRVLLEATEHG